MNRGAPPHVDDRESATAIRGVFDAAGYDADRIQERLGTTDRALAEGPDRPVYLRRVGEDALAVLLRLFMLDDPVPRELAERQLGVDAVSLLERAGLLERDAGDTVDGAVRVVPHEHVLIASDRFAEDNADHVAAVHGPSATLAHLTVRRPVGSALDVGTGNGIQAILLSTHAARVVATDVNERALAFAAFNTAVNQVDNVELRAGSFFEPVANERFDLIVTNPPYVISPESTFLFRDAGLRGDSVSEQVARALPDHLAEGAFGSAMISWIQPGEEATARPSTWFEGSGCDVLLIHTGTDEPLPIAAQWNRDSRADPEAYGAAIDRWLEYFAAEGIGLIAFGCAILRRRNAPPSAPNWIRSIRMPAQRLQPAGSQLEQMFGAHDFLAGLPDERRLLDERLVVDDALILEQRLQLGADGWKLRESSMSLTSGMRFSAGLDDVTAALVYGLDGSRTVREALPPAGKERSQETLEVVGLRVARQMLEAGFLRRPETERAPSE